MTTIIRDYDALKPEPRPPCKHPPARLYTWVAYDGTRVVCCCACGAILAGAAHAD